MKTTPRTVKQTARTQVVDVNGRKLKVTKSRTSVSLGGNVDGQKWGELSRTVNGWKWHCEELELHNLTRLELEKELLNLAGWELEHHNESLPAWHL